MDELIENLKVLLGTTFSLYLKTHGFHWNLEGIDFVALHPYLGEMYTTIWESIDDIAEQIRQLDAYAPCSMERFIKLSRIAGDNNTYPPREMLIVLLKDQETLITLLTEVLHMAEQHDKQGLVNYLAGRIEVHSKMRWQLRATAKRIA